MEAFSTENLSDRLPTLRFKATLERGIRLAQNFSTTVTETFQESVNIIGTSFSVDKESIDVFSESFIRSHLIFQLAKALETLL